MPVNKKKSSPDNASLSCYKPYQAADSGFGHKQCFPDSFGMGAKSYSHFDFNSAPAYCLRESSFQSQVSPSFNQKALDYSSKAWQSFQMTDQWMRMNMTQNIIGGLDSLEVASLKTTVTYVPEDVPSYVRLRAVWDPFYQEIHVQITAFYDLVKQIEISQTVRSQMAKKLRETLERLSETFQKGVATVTQCLQDCFSWINTKARNLPTKFADTVKRAIQFTAEYFPRFTNLLKSAVGGLFKFLDALIAYLELRDKREAFTQDPTNKEKEKEYVVAGINARLVAPLLLLVAALFGPVVLGGLALCGAKVAFWIAVGLLVYAAFSIGRSMIYKDAQDPLSELLYRVAPETTTSLVQGIDRILSYITQKVSELLQVAQDAAVAFGEYIAQVSQSVFDLPGKIMDSAGEWAGKQIDNAINEVEKAAANKLKEVINRLPLYPIPRL